MNIQRNELAHAYLTLTVILALISFFKFLYQLFLVVIFFLLHFSVVQHLLYKEAITLYVLSDCVWDAITTFLWTLSDNECSQQLSGRNERLGASSVTPQQISVM